MRLYGQLAEWWPLLDDPADYAEEAGVYGDLLAEACDAPIESLLELGSGGGNSACHLKQRFRRLVLTDISEDMLAVSRTLHPECEHRIGDMRTLRLEPPDLAASHQSSPSSGSSGAPVSSA